ncbi:SOS response-associated peptidase family protein [Pseudoxanthomonas wuyuanensis]|nr:SOS response-associated peptidase family protein [Pseudoxanthomonas wuyuanensis]
MIQADYDRFCRLHGAIMSLEDFAANVWDAPNRERKRKDRRRMPKAIEDWFLRPQRESLGQEIGEAIREARAQEQAELASDLVDQVERKALNEAKLATKPTKTAAEEVRKASNKITQLERRIADAERVQLLPRDYRFFPQWWLPVLVMEGGQLVLKPMRYMLRKPGSPASSDWIEAKALANGKKTPRRLSGTYNARRDNLTRWWQDQFGHKHGVVLIDSFFENVSLHKVEGRELAPGEPDVGVEVQFTPEPREPMLIACIWDHWEGAEEDPFDSFAFITDDPPPEVAAAGHDRIPIRLQLDNLMPWLTPQGRTVKELQAILDSRPEAFYCHEISRAA